MSKDWGRIAPGRGRKSWLPEGTVAAVVHDTLHATPDDGSTHWTTRLMAKRHGIGKDSVARIWKDHNLKPWRVERFKVSNDPGFEEKRIDVVGLYLNPPERAAVFCFDERPRSVPKDLDIHVILDNLSAHKSPEVKKWLAGPARARWHLHFTPDQLELPEPGMGLPAFRARSPPGGLRVHHRPPAELDTRL